MIILIDNYDSFTYNLYQFFLILGVQVEVYRHDSPELLNIPACCQAFVISPGPGHPQQTGHTLSIIDHFKSKLPFLGICLGHQCLAYSFGGTIKQAPSIMHGKTSLVEHDHKTVFQGLDSPLEVMRYHSLIVDSDSVKSHFDVTSTSLDDHAVMSIRHKSLPLEGIQFHPESIASQNGLELLKNFLTTYSIS